MACNTGTSLVPVINDKIHHFRIYGLYNGLAIMIDDETGSKWEHFQGECIQGALQGHILRTHPVRHITAEQAVEAYPDAQVAISTPTIRQHLTHFMFLRKMLRKEGHLPFMFHWSMQNEDARQHRMELGLGIWSEDGLWSRFYPMKTIVECGNLLFDTVGGKRLLVYMDPKEGAPAAMFTDASSAEIMDEVLRLNTGQFIKNGRLLDAHQVAIESETPRQIFTRWYGFAYTFPDCDIYGQH